MPRKITSQLELPNYKEQQQNIYDTVCKSHGQGPRVYFCVKLFELVDIYGGAEMNVTKFITRN